MRACGILRDRSLPLWIVVWPYLNIAWHYWIVLKYSSTRLILSQIVQLSSRYLCIRCRSWLELWPFVELLLQNLVCHCELLEDLRLGHLFNGVLLSIAKVIVAVTSVADSSLGHARFLWKDAWGCPILVLDDGGQSLVWGERVLSVSARDHDMRVVCTWSVYDVDVVGLLPLGSWEHFLGSLVRLAIDDLLVKVLLRVLVEGTAEHQRVIETTEFGLERCEVRVDWSLADVLDVHMLVLGRLILLLQFLASLLRELDASNLVEEVHQVFLAIISICVYSKMLLR